MNDSDSSTKDNDPQWRSMSVAELELEYSPSSAIGGNYQPFIEEYTERSAHSRARCGDVKTLRYGNNSPNLIDIVVPVDAAAKLPCPLLVFIHGGYWQEGSRADSFFGADYFIGQGIAYAAIGYSLAPTASLTQIVAECRQGIDYLIDNAESLNIDATKIVIAGSSAGAHLAAMCSTDTSIVKSSTKTPIAGLILLSGIYDLEPLVSTYVNDKVAMSVQEARDLSPLIHDATAVPEAILSWGEVETLEFKRQSRAFAKKLQIRGSRITHFESPKRNHFNIVHDMADRRTELGRRVLSIMGKS